MPLLCQGLLSRSHCPGYSSNKRHHWKRFITPQERGHGDSPLVAGLGYFIPITSWFPRALVASALSSILGSALFTFQNSAWGPSAVGLLFRVFITVGRWYLCIARMPIWMCWFMSLGWYLQFSLRYIWKGASLLDLIVYLWKSSLLALPLLPGCFT